MLQLYIHLYNAVQLSISAVEGSPSDPSWIGCWWLGYLICATGLLASCIPLWFFPKSCRETAVVARKSQTKRLEDSESTNENFGKWAKQEIMGKNDTEARPYDLHLLVSIPDALPVVPGFAYRSVPQYEASRLLLAAENLKIVDYQLRRGRTASIRQTFSD